MTLVAPKGAVCWKCAMFTRHPFLLHYRSRTRFSPCHRLQFLGSPRERPRHPLFRPWHSNSAGLEGISDHFLGDLCPCRLDPLENMISAWRLLFASWGELKWPRYHPCQILLGHIIFKGLLEGLIQGQQNRG